MFKDFYEVKFASAPSISSSIVSTLIDILPGRDKPPEINLLAPTLKEVEMAVKCLSNEMQHMLIITLQRSWLSSPLSIVFNSCNMFMYWRYNISSITLYTYPSPV